MTGRTTRILFGILVSTLTGLGLILVAQLPIFLRIGGADHDAPLIYTLSDFLVVPFVMGGIVAYFWRNLEMAAAEIVRWWAVTIGVILILSMVVLQEGFICLTLAMPLVVISLSAGWAVAGHIIRRIGERSNRLNAAVIPLALIVLVFDSATVRGFDGQVTDSIVIQAPPSTIWKYVVDYPAIQDAPDFWLWRIGLPAPIQATSDGHAVGAARQCRFTGGLAIGERIMELVPGRRLTFEVTGQPRHPEIMGHFRLRKGRFVLTANADGTTTVSGTSWYTLNVHPAAYYDLWTRCIIRNVHMRVMRHIRSLAESRPPNRPPALPGNR